MTENHYTILVEEIDEIIKIEQPEAKNLERLDDLLREYLKPIQGADQKATGSYRIREIYSLTSFAKGKIDLLAKYPNLSASIAKHALRRLGRVPTDSISIVSDFTEHKDSASVIYAYMINSRPKQYYEVNRYVNREMFLDLFGTGVRTKGVRKNLAQLGVNQKSLDDYESFLLNDMHYLMKPHDVEFAALLHDSEDLMDALMDGREWKRHEILANLLSGLDKVTLNERKFPKMAKVIVDLIDNHIGSEYSRYMPELYKEALHAIAKMGAKPGYQKSGVLNEQIEQLVADHPESLTLDSAFNAAIATGFKPAVMRDILNSPVAKEIVSLSDKEQMSLIKKVASTKVTPYRLVEEFGLKIGDKNLLKIKRESVIKDFGL